MRVCVCVRVHVHGTAVHSCCVNQDPVNELVGNVCV